VIKILKSYNYRITPVAVFSLLSSFAVLFAGETVNAAPVQKSAIKEAAPNTPKPAPDRRLRLNRSDDSSQPLADPSAFGADSAAYGRTAGQETTTDATPVGVSSENSTTVSLTGAVTRLDASAALDGNRPPIQGHIQGEQRVPFQGKIESLIDTPMEAQKPRSESIPPQTFRGWLENAHPQFALNASRNAPESVVCVKGQWDDSSKTLDKFQIPHVKIGGGKLADFPLQSTRVVIIDCAGDLNVASRQRLRDFVLRGGYLLSTDWALDGFLSATWPGMMQWNKATNRRDLVDATAFDTDPVLFNHAVTNAYWKLDQDSHLIHVINRDAVRILAKSKQLVADDPDREGILAAVFQFGRGYVMHMTGHFDNNSKLAIGNFLPDPAPVIKISLRQALAANFVVAGLTQTPIVTKRTR
jgi:hypothetical protein